MELREAVKALKTSIEESVSSQALLEKLHFAVHYDEMAKLTAGDAICPLSTLALTLIVLERLANDEKAIMKIMAEAKPHV